MHLRVVFVVFVPLFLHCFTVLLFPVIVFFLPPRLLLLFLLIVYFVEPFVPIILVFGGSGGPVSISFCPKTEQLFGEVLRVPGGVQTPFGEYSSLRYVFGAPNLCPAVSLPGCKKLLG